MIKFLIKNVLNKMDQYERKYCMYNSSNSWWNRDWCERLRNDLVGH